MLIITCTVGAMLLSAPTPACPATTFAVPNVTAPGFAASCPLQPAGAAARCNWQRGGSSVDQLAADVSLPWVDFVHGPPDKRLLPATSRQRKWDLSPLQENLFTAVYLALFVTLINFMVRDRPRRII